MRLSTAMMLGDSMRERTNQFYLQPHPDGGFCGCAIGGALLAVGRGRSIREGNDVAIREVFPWIEGRSSHGPRWIAEIAFGLNGHPTFEFVMKGKCTFEQLVDYVRSIEPNCDCNRFNCDCSKATEPQVQHSEVAQ